jgi:hypothetical protein
MFEFQRELFCNRGAACHPISQGFPMKKLLGLLALGLMLSLGTAHAAHAADAADAESACGEKAAEKKLAGAAKKSFLKKCVADAGGTAPAAPGASAACEKSAADKKLAGAAKTAHIKKCTADEKGPAAGAASAPKK